MTGAPGGRDAVEARIQSYLDEALVAARGRPRDVRRLLAEVERELRDSVGAGIGAGLDPWQAKERTLERFGPASGVVRSASFLRSGRVHRLRGLVGAGPPARAT